MSEDTKPSPDDPFTEFAKAMETTGETVEKIKAEAPAMPGPASSVQEIIDSYGEFAEYVKVRSAAERAYVKSRKDFLEAALNAELTKQGYVKSFSSNEPSPYMVGTISGEKFEASIDYSEKATFSQEKLREIDMNVTAGAPAVSLPPGLSVKYSANPEKAIAEDFKHDLMGAITGYEYERKVKFAKIEEAK
jgi:hypothetical protein